MGTGGADTEDEDRRRGHRRRGPGQLRPEERGLGGASPAPAAPGAQTPSRQGRLHPCLCLWGGGAQLGHVAPPLTPGLPL